MKEEIELLRKKALLAMYGIKDDESPEYQEILSKDIETIYARLTFLDELGPFYENNMSEVRQYLSSSYEALAKVWGKTLIEMIDSLTFEQKMKLRSFDYEKQKNADLHDKRSRNTYSASVKKLLLVKYPYENSFVKSIVEDKVEIDMVQKEVEKLSHEMDLDEFSPSSLEHLNDTNLQKNYRRVLISKYISQLDHDYDLQESFPAENNDRKRNPIGSDNVGPKTGDENNRKKIDNENMVSDAEYEKQIEEFDQKLEAIFARTGSYIISVNVSFGGNNSGILLEKANPEVTSMLNPETGKVELIEETSKELEQKAKKESKYKTEYFAIAVGEHIVFEPIGLYGNATYVIPKDIGRYNEAIRLNRKELWNREYSSRIEHTEHKVGEDGSRKYYDFSSSHLFEILEHCSKSGSHGVILQNDLKAAIKAKGKIPSVGFREEAEEYMHNYQAQQEQSDFKENTRNSKKNRSDDSMPGGLE